MSKTKAKPRGKALPPIYVGVYDGRLVPRVWSTTRFTARAVRAFGFKCDHVQKYVPERRSSR